ncbi:MAG: ABC transporter permease [Rhodobacterales bacterium]|nr:ABC transporter permease [Rhodobacterales bacterium]
MLDWLHGLFGPSLELLALSPPGWGGNLLRGLVNSLQIAAGAFGFGLVIGLLGASGKLYGGPVTRDLLEVYTTVVRAVPELVLILILYFIGTDLLNRATATMGYGSVEISGVAAGIWVLGVVQGAYATEVLRGAIRAVPPGQFDAGRAYGMGGVMLMRRVTIPAMLPYAIPGLANLWLIATKDTALLAIVGFAELTLETKQAAGSTKAYFTFYLAAGLLYLIVTLVSTFLFHRLENRSRRGLPGAMGVGRCVNS